jgi:hypothetical protein
VLVFFFVFVFFLLTGPPQVPMDIVTEATGVLASIRVTRYTTAKQVAGRYLGLQGVHAVVRDVAGAHVG